MTNIFGETYSYRVEYNKTMKRFEVWQYVNLIAERCVLESISSKEAEEKKQKMNEWFLSGVSR